MQPTPPIGADEVEGQGASMAATTRFPFVFKMRAYDPFSVVLMGAGILPAAKLALSFAKQIDISSLNAVFV
jgi:hypothetical protein